MNEYTEPSMEPTDITTTRTLSIRECGQNEFWLRDKIYEDPSILGLGELQPVMKEKTQSTGGRLDLLLKNPEDDSMFEVELQLGATDETHIIRTIEYWDIEKRRWPNRSHTAVLVAETINNRFFNVVHLLSRAVPIIGIQASIVEVGGIRAVHFTKIIDSYEEPEEAEPDSTQVYDEKHWQEKCPWSLECASWYRELLEKLYGAVEPKYFESYMSFTISGAARVWVNQRKKDRANIQVRLGEEHFQEVVDYLTNAGVPVRSRNGQFVNFTVNVQQLQARSAAHEWLVARILPDRVKQES